MTCKEKYGICLAICSLLFSLNAFSSIRLPGLVNDHMVLQRDVAIPVWGWTEPGNEVSVTFNHKVYTATASEGDGKWLIKMDPMPHGGPYEMTIRHGAEQRLVKDILIGDVWLCSGQSNMVLDFHDARLKELYAKDIASSSNDQVRQLLVDRSSGPTPAEDIKTQGWKAAGPQSLMGFTAAGYFFARELYKKYHVPIGLINSSYGGTIAEAWTSAEGLKAFPQFHHDLHLLADTAALNALKRSEAKKFDLKNFPSALYNDMIHPLIPYAIRGVVWYQGEFNATRAYEYRRLFPALIRDWRKNWQRDDLPFIFQQLPNFGKPADRPGEHPWAELREAQAMALSLPQTAMAVGIDIGGEDLHPVDKKDIGYRLSLAVRKLSYGEKELIASGPAYRSMKVDRNKIALTFDDGGSKLVSTDGRPLKRFAIAGEDRHFVWADAVIHGNVVEVSSPGVANPVAVRYGWAGNPEGCNLSNKAGLPAAPFRTDNWSEITKRPISLPAIFGDHMVLQGDFDIPIWGWSESGEKIEVAFQGKKMTTVADSTGKWQLKLGKYKAGGPYEMTIRGGQRNLVLKDILIGDVWVASGQSNMEFGIQTEQHAAVSIPEAKDSLIRFFYVPMAASSFPEDDIARQPPDSRNGKWVVCSPEAMADPKWSWHGFSAVSYYFSKEIRKTTGAPVGVIGSYKGATEAQPWMSPEELSKQPDAITPQSSSRYNAMIVPILHYGIKGVIWYQGESNGDNLTESLAYRQLFPLLIADWRAQWQQGVFPFLFVQLPGFKEPPVTPSEGNWPWVREAQASALSLPLTGMAVITDLGDADNIHPVNKLDVGKRLALVADHVVYGKDTVFSGPVFDAMTKEGNKIRLTFTHAERGLEAGGSVSDHASGNEVKGFGIAGPNKKFVWAHAVIDGNSVLVSSDDVTDPVAVRYNWADNPPGNLYNSAGLPAAPFRTDNWAEKVK